MKKLFNISILLFAVLLGLPAIQNVSAQTPAGTQIVNEVKGYFSYLNGQRDSVKSNLTTIVVQQSDALNLYKTVSSANAIIGGTVSYRLIVSNSGSTTLTGVQIVDTVSAQMQVVSTTRGSIVGNILTWNKGSLAGGQSDTTVVTARVLNSVSNNTSITNHAFAWDGAGNHADDTIRVLAQYPTNYSCQMLITVVPKAVIGNGTATSVITAFICDTLGNPKTDGTSVYFKTSLGLFSNGLDSLVTHTQGGWVKDSVHALISSNQIYTATVVVSTRDANVCARIDTQKIIFYPGAITGQVVNDDDDKPVAGVPVAVHSSSGNFSDSVTTDIDGRYLIPVPRTDTYSVVVVIQNILHQNVNMSTNVAVNVPSSGGSAPIVQNNVATGTIYYLVSGQPIPISGIKLYLYSTTTSLSSRISTTKKARSASAIAVPLDSTFTDAHGVYFFNNLGVGTYQIQPADTTVKTKRIMNILTNGEFVFNSNSPVVLNPDLSLSKNAPATALTSDTITYVIRVANSGTLSLSNAILTDTLQNAVTLISASQGGIYESASRRVVWNIGKFDSLSAKQYSISAKMNTSTDSAFIVPNTAWLTSNEIYPMNAQARTQVLRRVPTISLTKKASQDTVNLGSSFTYTIAIKNTGNVRLSNVSLVDTIHAIYLSPLTATNAVLRDSIVTWSHDSLGVNQSDTVRISVQVKTNMPDRRVIPNIVYAQSNETTQRAQVNIITRNIPTGPTATPSLSITKTASADTVLVGNEVTYTIRLQNTGNVTLTNVRVADTLSSEVIPVSVSSPALLSGNIVTYIKDSVVVNEVDSIKIVVRIPVDRANRESITNIAYGISNQTAQQSALVRIVTHVIVTNKSCRIFIKATPTMVVGNGVNATRIEALITDTLGNPKPNGTPITFKSSVGYFSNGMDSLVVSTLNGYAVDSLRAVISSNSIVHAKATVAARDSDVCFAQDTVDIVFYPGAISGVVIDNQTNLPVEGARVEVYTSAGALVDYRITPQDGSYLIPVPNTDSYHVKITIIDRFNNPVVTNTVVNVSVPGTGGNPPVLNHNYISGKVFFLISNRPVDAYRVKVDLVKLPTTSSNITRNTIADAQVSLVVDSTRTDSTGTYIFYNIEPGKYKVVTADSTIIGSMTVSDITDGKYIINVNVPIVLNPSIHLAKNGRSIASIGDTATYTISLSNSGNLSATAAVLVDSLNRAMRFVNAGSTPTVLWNYDSLSHKVFWNVGTLDSSAGTNHSYQMWITVRFADTISTRMTLKNNVYFTSNVTTRIDTFAQTEITVPLIKVEKHVARKIVEVGDVVLYTINVTNQTPISTLRQVRIYDRIPLGFKYLAGSSFIDSMRVTPNVGKQVVWYVADSLPTNATVRLQYRLVVGAGAMEGNGINTAYATATTMGGSNVRSSDVSERVEVNKGIFTDHGVIVGKVFFDRNHNAYQDEGENGVKGVELVMEDGTRIVTGDDGKYSMPDVYPGEHVIRVRKHTIPQRSILIAGYNSFAGDPASRFVNVTPSGIARADFYLDINGPDTLTLSQSMAKIGNINIQRIAEPRNVVFIEDEKLAPMKLSGVNFDVAKATLRPEAFPTLKQLAEILVEYPDISVTIVGHTDTNRIHTREFKDNIALSFARANSVKNYLMEKEHIDSSRVKTIGYGETKPIAWNKTKEGKALNRRVEFYFDNRIEQPKRMTTSVVFRIPINYEGSVNITKLEMKDSLDERMVYEPGSATLSDRVITPRIEGNKLFWTIDNLGTNYHKLLFYRATINKPSEKILKLLSNTTSFKYYFRDSIVVDEQKLTTNNEVAVAVRGRAVNYILSGVLFDVAKASLRPTAVSALITSAEALKQDPTATVLVEGHTDSNPIHTKEFSSNLELSEARAKTVVDKLVSEFGISRDRFRYIGFGPYRALTTNETAEGRQLNRRVEVRILTKAFVETVIPDGFIDSSNVARERFVPVSAKNEFDTTNFGRLGDQFIFRLEVSRASNTQSLQTMIVDSLPTGLQLVESSVNVKGIDSVAHSRVLIAKCSPSELASTITFRAEVVGPIDPQSIVDHKFIVVRKEKNGDVLIDRAKPIMLQVVNNQK